jgi:AraC-like DNA-binding protein
MGFVRAAILSDYPAVARELGLNPSAWLQDAGLSLRMLDQPDLLIPGDAVVSLLERSAVESGCSSVAMRMAERRQFSHFGVASLLLSQQRTLREAVAVIFQYRHLLNEALGVYLDETRETAVIRAEVMTATPAPATQATELGVAGVVQLIRAIIGAHWRPHAVHFAHRAPTTLEVHRRFFKCPIEFHSFFNGVSFPAADLDRENPSADPTMAAYARGFLEALPEPGAGAVIDDVRRLVYLLLPVGQATIKRVAGTLGWNVRTLQRELDVHGETYSSLLNGVRRELALRYLENQSFNLAHIAAQLGYASHGAFTRWFISEFGVAPNEWRRRRS